MLGVSLHSESVVTATARFCSLFALLGMSLGMDYSMTAKEFEQFRMRIYQECGINLNDRKKTLLVSRLSKRIRRRELNSVEIGKAI